MAAFLRGFFRCAFWWVALGTSLLAAAEQAVVRVGVLQFGTVAWEIEVMNRHNLLAREGVRVQVVPLAQKDAANVALQGGAVDVIVNDWLWVARQRAEGRDMVFVPSSTAVGSLLVAPGAPARGLADLHGSRIGVAGGPVDKSWLLLSAYTRKSQGEDAAQFFKPDFVAPPLLNELAQRGELPVALNYWHYAARLRALGWRELIGMPQILDGLGIDRSLPLVGWVFGEAWAAKNPAAISGLLRASAAAKQLMRESDAVWQEIRPLTRVDEAATLAVQRDEHLRALRDGFRAGIPPRGPAAFKAAEAAAARAFEVLAREGGPAVVGKVSKLPAGVFWAGAAGI